MELSQLRTANASEISQLRTANASEISQLRTANASLASEITLLQQVNTSEIALLQQFNASQASELSRAVARTAADEKELHRLKAHCDNAEKSKQYFFEENLRLNAENLNLRSHQVHADGVPG